MIRAIVCAAVAAACLTFAAPAQARMANPGLNEIAPANVLVQDVQYRRDRHRDRRYNRHRYRHCWNHRVRVRVGYHRHVWRIVRRCDWRYRSYRSYR